MNRTFQTLTLVVIGLSALATGFGIGRATSPNQKAVNAAEQRADKAETALVKSKEETATQATHATFWEATSKARAEELSRVTVELTLCNARPTTNTGKIKNNVRVK